MAGSFFTDDSMIRRVQRESAVALSGPRTLLMQAAHPVAFAGFFAHTGALDAPYERLQRTVRVLNLIGFGDKDEAQRATRRVRAIHRRVRGELSEPAGRFPAGTPYSADDPALLLWILACMADSALVVYQRYVRSLPRDERDAFWQDYKVVGREFGLRDADMPAEIEDFERYMAEMVAGDDLFVTAAARELALEIVMRPPVPLHARPMLELTNFVTVGLLPARVRRMYGLSWDPARTLVLRGGAEYAKRVVVPLLPARLRYRGGPRRRAA
ncbi:MAG TPA: oxygenase MpaB family protein [Solirubrobacteraceae bacterium]|nr:oxygenase MpaB family protein [Solirubrobacteraceae bacterium]